jgi:limonene-1,2-epoxide hydrolase
MRTTIADQGQAEGAAFVERFANAWASPELGRFENLWHPSIVLEQPGLPRAVGIEEARSSFRRLLKAFPGLHGEVLSWQGDGTIVFIELRLRVPAGRRPLEWALVDKIQIEDGLARQRTTYMDPGALLVGVIVRPSLWARMPRLFLAPR